ncbi:hypothetical protein Vadar_005005 [Vaccinium darrowii]|uniref:Uncharacterized protein n=1 Tax=Vaccinium darrowii TaxID=229202 RepID=A0ACB7XYB8_9ERIC|nr:hypothetical protein Vadar_005005 [Vaccinium darrowii]
MLGTRQLEAYRLYFEGCIKLAIKCLSAESKQGTTEFDRGNMISTIRRPNLVELLRGSNSPDIGLRIS